jgi:ribonucleotide monophosphatase NagD (HAD superfamily)
MVKINSITTVLDSIKSPILGLDAYGVIYNDRGIFDTIPDVFNYCNQRHIPIYLMTNNSTQSIHVIEQKLLHFNIPIPKSHIISSGCGIYELPQLQRQLNHQRVFIYGYESSKQYAIDAGATCVTDPCQADVIVMAAALNCNNHHVYRQVFKALKNNPNMPIICINPDHYVLNQDDFFRVMGFYAHQMGVQLDRNDIIWMGKPHPLFSELVTTRLANHQHVPNQLVFCDDNPHNVSHLITDTGCCGIVVTSTGVCSKYNDYTSIPNKMFQIEKCKI